MTTVRCDVHSWHWWVDTVRHLNLVVLGSVISYKVVCVVLHLPATLPGRVPKVDFSKAFWGNRDDSISDALIVIIRLCFESFALLETLDSAPSGVGTHILRGCWSPFLDACNDIVGINANELFGVHQNFLPSCLLSFHSALILVTQSVCGMIRLRRGNLINWQSSFEVVKHLHVTRVVFGVTDRGSHR